MTTEVLNLGAVAVIFIFAVKEFFSFLKSGKDTTSKSKEKENELTVAMLTELQKMNGNHLHSIQEAIEKGTEKSVIAFSEHAEREHQDSMKIVELLGEIKGNLSIR